MQATVVGVKRVKGIAKNSGNPFDMSRLLLLSPIESVAQEKFQVAGAGFEVSEVPLDVSALPLFMGVAYPAKLDLIVEPRPFRGGFETVVTGIQPK